MDTASSNSQGQDQDTQTPTLTVSQLTQAIKLSLEATFPVIGVQGEISNFKRQASGHLYFSLKDRNAQISAVMFRGDASRLKQLPRDGDEVTVRGEINVYPPRGSYQIVVRDLQLAGIGQLLAKLEQLKEKLRGLGWFEAEHKKPLPHTPKRIGVVTSPTGAAVQDILNVLNRRHGGFQFLLAPAKVQGAGAAEEVARAIEFMNHHQLVDVMIVGRGGGSIEDLWAFNEEIVAKAIFESKIPIISAVGHETDTTLADFVADVRAPTPSAAAEMVIAEREQQLKYLQQAAQHLRGRLTQQLEAYRQRLRDVMRHPMLSVPSQLMGLWVQRLDELRDQTDRAMRQRLQSLSQLVDGRRRQLSSLQPTVQLKHYQSRLQTLTKHLDQSFTQQHSLRVQRLKAVADALRCSDPKALLGRGYSILFNEKDGSIINSVRGFEPKDSVRVMVADGEARATITEISPSDKHDTP